VSGPTHYWTLLAQYVLCNILDRQGRSQQAETLIDKVVAGLRASLGDSSPDTLNAIYVQGNIASNLHHYQAAERIYREAIALRGNADAGTHPESLFPINGLAVVLIETGRADEALALLDDALPKADGRSDGNIIYGRMLGTYGYAQMKKGDWQAARATLEKAAAIVAAVHDPQHPSVQFIHARLLATYRQLGLTAEADALATKVDPPR
jgi:serine/threonine-protein kinase